MATDATGTPTSPDNIPTYNTAVDAPSGKGFNAAMASIQTALNNRISTPGGIATGEFSVWNGSAWVRSTVQRPSQASLATGSSGILTFLRGDGTWAKGSMNLLWDSTDAGVTFPAASITTPTLDGSFKHLVMLYQARSSAAVFLDDMWCQLAINGGAVDNAGNYNSQRMWASGTGISAADNISAIQGLHAGFAMGTSGDNATLGNGVVFFPNYSNATNRAAHIALSIAQAAASNATGANRLNVHGGEYKNTVGPITKLNLFLQNGSFAATTRISIYGI